METIDTHIYMPTQEIIITLQDVAILWGLPICSDPVTGLSDKDWSAELDASFGFPMDNATTFKSKKVTKKKMAHKLGDCPIIA
jgi:hypothetical protein